MAPPDATPKSLFPAAATPASSALPRAGGSFGTPSAVEFPMFTDPDDAAMTAFGSRVQADLDPDQLDGRVSHVRDAQYEPGGHPPEVSRVVSATAPVTRSREHGRRRKVVLLVALLAVGVLAGLAGAFLLTR
jgi:hypothetical protein